MKCANCKKDLFKEKIRFYHYANVYCYDCHKLEEEKIRERYRIKKEEEKDEIERGIKGQIRKLHKDGMKPSELSQKFKLPVSMIYQILTQK